MIRQTEIRRPVELHHVEPLAEHVDERHEPLALQPVLVKLGRMPVRGGDDHHPALEQFLEQPPDDHRVGDVGDLELVEAEQRRGLGDLPGDDLDRVVLSLLARTVDGGMRLLHEGVEMDPALGRDRRGFVEEVHQHRLAAPDAAVDVEAEPLLDLLLAPAGEAEQAEDRAPPFRRVVGPETNVQQLQLLDRGALGVVRPQRPAAHQIPIPLERSLAHAPLVELQHGEYHRPQNSDCPASARP